MVQENCVKEKLVIIVGPTGVGKTALGVRLAKQFDGEVISADSAQVYRGLDIGSAKATKSEMQGIKHHLIDIKSPFEGFNAAEFATLARASAADIASRGKLPIVVGGTGMFIRAMLFDMSVTCPSDSAYRKELENIAAAEGDEALYEMLKKVDSQSAAVIHPHHKSRIIRALEIYHLTNKKKSDFIESQTSPYDYLLICLKADRKVVYDRINARVDKMIESGLIDEVKRLKEMGLNESHQSMKAIGYKEVLEFLDGKTTKEECIEKIKLNSRHYAKRQETYFKKMAGIVYMEYDQQEEIIKLVKEFING